MQGIVVCFLDGLFLVLEVQVYLVLGDQKLNFIIIYGNNFFLVKVLVKVIVEEEGIQQLLCVVMLGIQIQEIWQIVIIYSFLVFNVNLIKLEVLEGIEVIVECEVYFRVKVMLNGVLVQLLGLRVQFLLKVILEDNGCSFFCFVILEVVGQFVYKNQIWEFCVLYGF